VLQTRFINPSTGGVGVDARLQREECPNDGTLLDQRTEFDVIVDMDANCEAMLQRIEKVENLAEIGRAVVLEIASSGVEDLALKNATVDGVLEHIRGLGGTSCEH